MTAAQQTRPTATRWSLWSTYAFLAVDDDRVLAAARALAVRRLAEVELACSRFRTDSDLSRVNAAPGTWVEVSPLLVTLVRVALEAAETTGGLVDPCLGRPLACLGYDVDLAELTRHGAPAPVVPPVPTPGAWREVRLDDRAVRIPREVALDLGATAKAWAADLVALEVAETFGCVTVVSLGGDVRVAAPGDLPVDAAVWPVRVAEHPTDPAGPVVDLRGGLATSSTAVRRWRQHAQCGGRAGVRDGVRPDDAAASHEVHHLLDPRTAQPAMSPYRTVSAVGASATAANIAATAALVSGPDATTWLESRAVTARLLDHTGTVTRVGGWPAEEHRPSPNGVQ